MNESGGWKTSCVFLPDPNSEGFGEHVSDPASRKGCYCLTLYGEPQPFGCRWYEIWMENTLRAVENKAQLVVITKKDGGLGNSQKGEVRFLQKLKCGFAELSIRAFANSVAGHIYLSTHWNSPKVVAYMSRVEAALRRAGMPVYAASANSPKGLQTAFAVVAILSDDYGERTSSDYDSFKELKFFYNYQTRVIPLRISAVYPPRPVDSQAAEMIREVFPPCQAYFDDRHLQRPDEFANFVRESYLNLLGLEDGFQFRCP